jgi:hypothetical protein
MGALASAACNDVYDDTAIFYLDAGASDGASADVTVSDGGVDAVADATSDASNDVRADAPAAPDASGPARLLLTYSGYDTTSASELVAVDVASGTIDGRLRFKGFGTTTTQAPDPYLLEQGHDVVARLDPATPWLARSSWSVALNDATDGGATYSDPSAVIVNAGTKAYVLRFTRNEIAIVDTSQTADGGAPIGTIDLHGLVQPADHDGTVEQTAAAYSPRTGLVYLLLGNIDKTLISPTGTTTCGTTHPTVVAIDVATDKVVPLANGDSSGAIPMHGYGPIGPAGFAYDAANDRILVLHGGCNEPGSGPDAGPGPMSARILEEVNLFTGQARTLVDLDAYGFPNALLYLDASRAIVQLSLPDFSGYETHVWDPALSTLGAAIPNAPDSFVYDGAGNLVGVTTVYDADGGSTIEVASVRIADGKKTTITSNPFTLAGGYVSGVDLWPHP